MKRTSSDPGTWQAGWKADAETMSAAPRWTCPKSGKHKYKTPWTPSTGRRTNPGEEEHTYLNNTMYTLGGGYRDTWIQAKVRKNRNPGPGHYKTDTDMPASSTLSGFDWMRTAEGKKDKDNWRDEVNINNTKKERAPKYTTLGRRELREASLVGKPRLSCLKPSYMNVPIGMKSTDVRATPGPGEYQQTTTFGAASGGSRTHYF